MKAASTRLALQTLLPSESPRESEPQCFERQPGDTGQEEDRDQRARHRKPLGCRIRSNAGHSARSEQFEPDTVHGLALRALAALNGAHVDGHGHLVRAAADDEAVDWAYVAIVAAPADRDVLDVGDQVVGGVEIDPAVATGPYG